MSFWSSPSAPSPATGNLALEQRGLRSAGVVPRGSWPGATEAMAPAAGRPEAGGGRGDRRWAWPLANSGAELPRQRPAGAAGCWWGSAPTPPRWPHRAPLLWPDTALPALRGDSGPGTGTPAPLCHCQDPRSCDSPRFLRGGRRSSGHTAARVRAVWTLLSGLPFQTAAQPGRHSVLCAYEAFVRKLPCDLQTPHPAGDSPQPPSSLSVPSRPSVPPAFEVHPHPCT